MICKVCGKKLNDTDRFCSNCGTRTEFERDENFVFTAPERDFEWNVHSFPDGKARKTEDAIFDWEIEEGEFRSWPAHAPEPETKIPEMIFAGTADGEKKETQEEISSPGGDALKEDDMSSGPSIVDIPAFEDEPSPKVSDEAAEKDKTINNVKLEPVDDIEDKTKDEQKNKKKKGFFGLFSKDKDSTLEQPVITDEQIEQAKEESLKEETASEGEIGEEIPQKEAAAEDKVKEEIVAAEEETKQDVSEFKEELKEKSKEEESETDNAVITDISEIPEAEMLFEKSSAVEPEQAAQPEETKEKEESFKPQHIEFDWSQPIEKAEEKESKPSDINWAMTMDPREDFLAMQEKKDHAIRPQKAKLSEDSVSAGEHSAEPLIKPAAANELKEEHEDDITGNALEQELFGGAAVAGVVDGGEGLSRHSAKIDQFYTFNKRNEEFQKLLDKEYEKFREGRPLDDDTFNANVEAIRAGIPESEAVQRGDTISVRQMEEINDAIKSSPMSERKTMPYKVIDDDSIFKKVDAPAAEKAETETPDLSGAVFSEYDMPIEETAPEISEEVKSDIDDHVSKPEITEDDQKTAEPSENLQAKEKPEKTAPSENGGKGGKIAIIILSIILALLLLALGIKLFAPDSSFAKSIDNAADKVVTIFTGDEDQPQKVSADADEFDPDLNGTIQTSLDENYDNYIEEIAYDPGLVYEKKTKNIRITI